MTKKRTVLVVVAILAVVVVEGIVLLYAAGSWPSTIKGWILLLTVGPIALVGAEWLSGRILSKELSRRISTKGFSVMRIGFLLITSLALIAALIAVVSVVAPWLGVDPWAEM